MIGLVRNMRKIKLYINKFDTGVLSIKKKKKTVPN